jgi:hypothetical protein
MIPLCEGTPATILTRYFLLLIHLLCRDQEPCGTTLTKATLAPLPRSGRTTFSGTTMVTRISNSTETPITTTPWALGSPASSRHTYHQHLHRTTADLRLSNTTSPHRHQSLANHRPTARSMALLQRSPQLLRLHLWVEKSFVALARLEPTTTSSHLYTRLQSRLS